MPEWTLIAIDTPLVGSAQRAELSMASNRSATFSLTSASTLSFSMPGRHWQTALLEPLTTDILLYRNDFCVQRYRVMSANFEKQGGALTASFTCSSYKALLNAAIFHESDTRRFISVEQTDIAWTIINEAQTKSKGDWDLTRGMYPYTPVTRTLDGDWEAATPQPYYYEVGKRKGDAVDELAAMTSGFEWDIEPSRLSAVANRTSLKFHTWNAGDRRQYSPRCPFVLDDGGNVISWSRQSAPTEFANVVRMVGRYPEGVGSADDPPPAYWSPASGNPGGDAPEGRWERSLSSEAQSMSGIQSEATAALEKALAYQPVWSVDIAPGRWSGPSEMWIGDICRLIVLDGPIDVDADVRVHEIRIDITDDSGESLSLTLDRPARSYTEFRADLERRILNLERR